MNPEEINILAETFLIPKKNAELQSLIEHSLAKLENHNMKRKELRFFKAKLNELMMVYNDRKQKHIYTYVE